MIFSFLSDYHALISSPDLTGNASVADYTSWQCPGIREAYRDPDYSYCMGPRDLLYAGPLPYRLLTFHPPPPWHYSSSLHMNM